MRKKILSLALSLFIGVMGLSTIISTAYADAAKESSSFEVFDILTTKDLSASGETTSENIKDAADASGNSTVAEVLLKAINILTLFVGTFAFVIILIAGLRLIIAQGDQNKIDSSKKMISQAIIGLVFAFGAYIMVTFVQSLLY